MSLMIAEVYDALISAGAPEDKARKAAETLAAYDDRLDRIERRVAGVEYRLRLLQWQVGVLMVALAPGFWLLLRVASKVGALG